MPVSMFDFDKIEDGSIHHSKTPVRPRVNLIKKAVVNSTVLAVVVFTGLHISRTLPAFVLVSVGAVVMLVAGTVTSHIWPTRVRKFETRVPFDVAQRFKTIHDCCSKVSLQAYFQGDRETAERLFSDAWHLVKATNGNMCQNDSTVFDSIVERSVELESKFRSVMGKK